MAEVRAYARELADNVSPRSMAVIKRQLWAVSKQPCTKPSTSPTSRWRRASAPKTSAKASRTSSRSARRGSPGVEPGDLAFLDALAGTWCKQDANEFERPTAPFAKVDAALWG